MSLNICSDSKIFSTAQFFLRVGGSRRLSTEKQLWKECIRSMHGYCRNLNIIRDFIKVCRNETYSEIVICWYWRKWFENVCSSSKNTIWTFVTCVLFYVLLTSKIKDKNNKMKKVTFMLQSLKCNHFLKRNPSTGCLSFHGSLFLDSGNIKNK